MALSDTVGIVMSKLFVDNYVDRLSVRYTVSKEMHDVYGDKIKDKVKYDLVRKIADALLKSDALDFEQQDNETWIPNIDYTASVLVIFPNGRPKP